jgi:hypothetical protein
MDLAPRDSKSPGARCSLAEPSSDCSISLACAGVGVAMALALLPVINRLSVAHDASRAA